MIFLRTNQSKLHVLSDQRRETVPEQCADIQFYQMFPDEPFQNILSAHYIPELRYVRHPNQQQCNLQYPLCVDSKTAIKYGKCI